MEQVKIPIISDVDGSLWGNVELWQPLRNCPFCNGEAVVVFSPGDHGEENYYVTCDKSKNECYFVSSTGIHQDKPFLAIDDWQRRPEVLDRVMQFSIKTLDEYITELNDMRQRRGGGLLVAVHSEFISKPGQGEISAARMSLSDADIYRFLIGDMG